MDNDIIIQSTVRRGSGNEHLTYCQDFLVHQETENYIFGAVMDGCSGGQDSHFASALFGKILNKAFNEYRDLEKDVDLEMSMNTMMCFFFESLCEIRNELNLTKNELQTTLIVFIYDKEKGNLIIRTFGDGSIQIYQNDLIQIQNTVYGKSNMPYYFVNSTLKKEGNMNMTEFEEWLNMQPTYYAEQVDHFAIMTDGIDTFKDKHNHMIDPEEIITFVFNDELKGNTSALNKKLTMLATGRGQKKGNPFERDFKVIHEDDVSILRIVNPSLKEPEDELNIATEEIQG